MIDPTQVRESNRTERPPGSPFQSKGLDGTPRPGGVLKRKNTNYIEFLLIVRKINNLTRRICTVWRGSIPPYCRRELNRGHGFDRQVCFGHTSFNNFMGLYYLFICLLTARALSPNCFGWQHDFRHAADDIDWARRTSWTSLLWADRYYAFLSSAKSHDTEHVNSRSAFQCFCPARFGLFPLNLHGSGV